MRSPYDVTQTIARLDERFRSAGLTLRPTHLPIFDVPSAGTPLMLASPTAAIDRPAKALIWEDADGKIWVTYNKPESIQRRHSVLDHLAGNLSGITTLIQRVLA